MLSQPNGRLGRSVLESGAHVMIEDLYEYVRIWRDNTNTANFQTRISTASRSVAYRNVQSVQGPSSPEYSVMLAPAFANIRADDEAWTSGRRYRVISVDPQPHRLQVLLLNLQ